MNILRRYIRDIVQDGGKASIGDTLPAHLDRAIRRATMEWTVPLLLPPPRTLQEVIIWEVNKYLTSLYPAGKAANSQATTYTERKNFEEDQKTRKSKRRRTSREIFASKSSGELLVRGLNPNVGVIKGGKLVIFEYTETVVVGGKYIYWELKGRYHVKGTAPLGIETPYGIPFGNRVLLQQLGTDISTVWPNALEINTKGQSNTVMEGKNAFEAMYSEAEYAVIDGTFYIEYESDNSDLARPNRSKISKRIDLKEYFVNTDRWHHTEPGKVVLYKGYAVVSLLKIEDQIRDDFVQDPNFPASAVQMYGTHNGTSWICHNLLIINRSTNEIKSYEVPKSNAELQINHVGYVDFMIQRAGGRLIVAKISSHPTRAQLDITNTCLRSKLADQHPSHGEDQILRSRSALNAYLIEQTTGYNDFVTYLEPEVVAGNRARAFVFSSYDISVSRCDINEDMELVYEKELFTQSGVMTSQHGVDVMGGYTHAVLSQDPINSKLFLMRGYEVFTQLPVPASEKLEMLRSSTAVFLSNIYKEGIYPGDVVMFGGNKIYSIDTGEELADIPGEVSVPLSSLTDDPIGASSVHSSLTNSCIIKKFLNTPKFGTDAVTDMLEQRDVSFMFYGGTNNGEMYYDSVNSLHWVYGSGVGMNRNRLVTLCDISQPADRQIRFIVQGLHSVANDTAKSLRYVTEQTKTVQGAFLIIPNKYSETPNPFGYHFYGLGPTLMPLTERVEVNPSTGYNYVWLLHTLKLDFIQPSVDQIYVVSDGQMMAGWYSNAGANGIGDYLPYNYNYCYKLVGDTLQGWAGDFTNYTGKRKNYTVTEIDY